MRQLIDELNKATKAYDEGKPIMSDQEWDKLYQRLADWEKESGVIYPDSPTQSINYEVKNNLKKVKHNHPMLSLNKIYNDTSAVDEFASKANCIYMLKLDGLTCSLTYKDGQLIGAETRGDGYEGEDILHNARVVSNIPQHIPNMGLVTVDGEIIATYNNFKPFADKYSNPRNFAAGSIRLLDSKESKRRNLSFVAWDTDLQFPYLSEKLEELYEIGFEVVPYVDTFNLQELSALAQFNSYPIDGIVCKYNDCGYYRSLGATAHHPLGAVAYKFYNEDYETKLLNIEWSMGRMGTLTPVAIFQPTEIEGAIIERANLHNLAIIKELFGGEAPKANQIIHIYRANEIIPQVRSVDKDSGDEPFSLPSKCPCCGGDVKINGDELVCSNSQCSGKIINQLDHMFGIKGLNAKGLSKATLEKLLEWGWIETPLDVFKLKEHRAEWLKKPGFGVKSVDRVLDAIEAARHTTLHQFLASLGIPLIGHNVTKELVKYFNSYEELRDSIDKGYDFEEIPNFGLMKSQSLLNFDYTYADEIYKNYITIVEEGTPESSNLLEGAVVAITGKLTHYKNRAELERDIEAVGGKVVKSISGKTTMLINNDNTSISTKNREAKERGIPIVTEQEFIDKYLTF